MNGNGARGQNRRAKFSAVALVLISLAFIICLVYKVDIRWFEVYSERVVFLLLFVVGGLTATDAIKGLKGGPPMPPAGGQG